MFKEDHKYRIFFFFGPKGEIISRKERNFQKKMRLSAGLKTTDALEIGTPTPGAAGARVFVIVSDARRVGRARKSNV